MIQDWDEPNQVQVRKERGKARPWHVTTLVEQLSWSTTTSAFPFHFPTPFWTFYRVKNGTTLWNPHHWGDMARDKGGGLRIAVDIRSLSILRNIDVPVSPFPWFLANGILSFSSPHGRQKCRLFFLHWSVYRTIRTTILYRVSHYTVRLIFSKSIRLSSLIFNRRCVERPS